MKWRAAYEVKRIIILTCDSGGVLPDFLSTVIDHSTFALVPLNFLRAGSIYIELGNIDDSIFRQRTEAQIIHMASLYSIIF